MRRKLLVIGIGIGNPEHMTVQAVAALNRVDVFFIPNKGEEKQDLARLRREICERFIRGRNYRMVDFDTPRRDASAAYRQSVDDWHEAVARVYELLLAEELGEGECGGILVWGDPSLYDSTLRILDRIRSGGRFELDYEVIPGIGSAEALAAAHKIVLNAIGGSVVITTGRKLAGGWPGDAESVLVMLDGEGAYKNLDEDVDIYWGAYLGTPDEILIAGKLREVRDRIERVRQEARARKGWIMDTYLLKRRPPD